MNDAFDWATYLSIFHADRAGVAEDILSRAFAGPSTPYRWLARAVSRRAEVILDVGCGAGAMSRELARGGRTVVGVDLSFAELELAASRSGTPWLCADGRRLPIADESCDAVTSSMGVVVIRPVEKLFAEVARVLKPGGVFAFMAPTIRPLAPRDLHTLGRIAMHLHGVPQFPGPTEVTGYVPALSAVGLRKVEDRRERYRFTVMSAEDARLVIAALYLPMVSAARLQAAIDWMSARVERSGPFTVAIPMRRFVAVK
ncbi:class I SAM-dependent methyltransferase [Propionicicella superfundia]|uniref:class I SAM-dependent methyltransferase n=1 Tax=Propionicicella superfundia TaxID=348582 RepID=UPI00040BB310|nr:class I SAM-dependent methyltransferase [Propionicicella superfundia]